MRNLTEVQTAQNELLLNETDIKKLFMQKNVMNIQVTTDAWAFHLDLKFDAEKDAYVMANRSRVGEIKNGEEMTCSPDMNTGCNFTFVEDFGMKKIITNTYERGDHMAKLDYYEVSAIIVQYEDGRTQFINKNFIWSETPTDWMGDGDGNGDFISYNN